MAELNSCKPLSKDEKSEADKLFDDYVNLARHIAKKFADKTSKSYTELRHVAESRLAFEICAKKDKYDPEKAKRSTWYYQCVYWALQTYCNSGNYDVMTMSGLTADEDFNFIDTVPDTKGDLLQSCRDLSEEAQTIVKIICEAPDEIAEDLKTTTKGRAREGVKWYLEKIHLWQTSRIEKAWKEVEGWVKEIQSGATNYSGFSVKASGF